MRVGPLGLEDMIGDLVYCEILLDRSMTTCCSKGCNVTRRCVQSKQSWQNKV